MKLLDKSNYRFGLNSKWLLWRENAYFLSKINAFYDLPTVCHPEDSNSEKTNKNLTKTKTKSTPTQLISLPKLRKVI